MAWMDGREIDGENEKLLNVLSHVDKMFKTSCEISTVQSSSKFEGVGY